MKHVYDLLALTDVVREACTASIRLENCRDLALTGMQTDESGARPNAVEALQRILAEAAGRRFDESQAAADRGVDLKEVNHALAKAERAVLDLVAAAKIGVDPDGEPCFDECVEEERICYAELARRALK